MHYGLGEIVYYNEANGDNIEDFPFLNIPKGIRYKYNCDISDDDYQKLYEIYKRELNKSQQIPQIPNRYISFSNNNSEKLLSVCSIIFVVLGLIAFIVLGIMAASENDFDWVLFGIGIGSLFASIIEFAFFQVIINISKKIDILGKCCI